MATPAPRGFEGFSFYLEGETQSKTAQLVTQWIHVLQGNKAQHWGFSVQLAEIPKLAQSL